jgi:hypothetical protein
MCQQQSEKLGGDQKYNVNLDLPNGVCVCVCVCVCALHWTEICCVEEWSVGHMVWCDSKHVGVVFNVCLLGFYVTRL